jgi:hypothetical protein
MFSMFTLLTYSTMQDIIWKADCHSTSHAISCFLYGARRFITVFTKARHWTLSWASRIQFAPSIPISLRSILMLSSHLRLGLPMVSYLPTSQPKPWMFKHTGPKHFSYEICSVFTISLRIKRHTSGWACSLATNIRQKQKYIFCTTDMLLFHILERKSRKNFVSS